MKKQPEITAHTRQKLIDTFWEIAEERGIDKVTVSEITKRAHYNRSTFYEYFSDVKQLIMEIEDEILHDLPHNTKLTTLTLDNPDELRALTQELIHKLVSYDNKFFLLIGKQGDPLFISKLRNDLTKQLLPLIYTSSLVNYSEYITAYISSATIGLMSYWYENGKRISAKELGEILYQITFNGSLGFLQTK